MPTPVELVVPAYLRRFQPGGGTRRVLPEEPVGAATDLSLQTKDVTVTAAWRDARADAISHGDANALSPAALAILAQGAPRAGGEAAAVRSADGKGVGAAGAITWS